VQDLTGLADRLLGLGKPVVTAEAFVTLDQGLLVQLGDEAHA
jgi:hypothetical protein